MRFFKRLAGFLGLGGGAHDHDGEVRDLHDDEAGGGGGQSASSMQPGPAGFQETGLPRRGFSVPVQVAVDRHNLQPLLIPCFSGDGGVQGLRWYAKRLRVDEDGDVADEFLEEVITDGSTVHVHQQKPLPRFQVKYKSRPAKVRNQVLSADGRIQQCVENEGKLQWV